MLLVRKSEKSVKSERKCYGKRVRKSKNPGEMLLLIHEKA